jgi:nucleotide-binding universal stress UspA family protein
MSTHIDHVILGTDFSAGWQQGCSQLPPLVELLGIKRMTVVHVPDSHPLAADENLKQRFQPQLDDAARRLAAQTSLHVDAELHHGTPAEALLSVARDRGADGVVVTCRGHSKLHGLFLGNVVLDLARLTDLPVVILPAEPPAAPQDGPVMLATDGSVACAAAEALFEDIIADHVRGLVVAVDTHPDDPGQSRISSHVRQLASTLDRATPTVVKGNPREVIPEIAKRERARLIVVGQRGHNALTQVMLGSTAEAVCRAAVCPVLVVPDRHDED